MKPKTLLTPLIPLTLLTLLLVGCNKEKTCRCAVPGEQTVRIIKINKGECSDLRVYTYHTPLDVLMTDSIICTDYEFLIDTIYDE